MDSSRWDFQHHDGEWEWQCVYFDGSVSPPSIPHKSFGSVVAEAAAKGFSHGESCWLVEDDVSITHFVPGEKPQTLRK